MAPSPTGLLHIGGVRTFLFNWLFARGRGGECLLRIENTDTSREVDESVDADRALAPLARHRLGRGDDLPARPSRARAGGGRRLVAEGTAYEDEGAIRIRMPDEGSTGWDDAIKGRIEFPNAQLEDLVLVRSDGRPTYNFASPLDDWLDGITHVIRGDDHVSNTPKQIHVLRALGAEPPVYAHVPSVFGEDGRKLSKRHGAVSVDEFRAAGYVPEALMNFLALLGWAPDGETTIMSARRARRALLARARRLEPGDVRLREARLDERRLSARALAGRVRRSACRVPARAGERLARGAHPRGGAARAGEDRPTSASSRAFAGFLFHDVEPDPTLLDVRILTAADAALEHVDPWTVEEIEVVAEAPLRRAGGEAAHGVPRRFAWPSPARRSRPASTRASSSWARRPHWRAYERARRPRERSPGPPGRRARSHVVARRLAGADRRFASATEDPQWIHVDPERAAAGPFGTTIAHGYLTLSLCVPMLDEVMPEDGLMSVNYGVNRVRFPAAVPSGARMRGRFRVLEVEDVPAVSAGRSKRRSSAMASRSPYAWPSSSS